MSGGAGPQEPPLAVRIRPRLQCPVGKRLPGAARCRSNLAAEERSRLQARGCAM